jgi:hypothetical protein
VSVPKLKQQAEQRFGEQKDYGEMLTGDQVRQCVTFSTACLSPLYKNGWGMLAFAREHWQKAGIDERD